MKKILFSLVLTLLGVSVFSQGLDSIYIELFHTTTAAEAAADANLNEGDRTYRVFVDMADGYELQAVYGSAAHALILGTEPSKGQSSSYFYNEPNMGVTLAQNITSFGLTMLPNLLYDSWWTIAGFSSDQQGVPLVYDASGYINPAPALPSVLSVFDMALFGTTNGVGELNSNTALMYVEGGLTGVDDLNRVLIGQFTTDGELYGELNVQIRPVGSQDPENWVARDPITASGELTHSSLIFSTKATIAPTVDIADPVSPVVTGTAVTFTATVTDPDYLVAPSVEFFVDGVSIGTDASSPYSMPWVASPEGDFMVVAVVTDDDMLTDSDTTYISVRDPNNAPSVTINAPVDGAVVNVNEVTTISADVVDSDGTIDEVDFQINGVSHIVTSPVSGDTYEFNWTPGSLDQGPVEIIIVATDDDDATSSEEINITVIDPSGSDYRIISILEPCYSSDIFCVSIERYKNPAANIIGFDVEMKYEVGKVKPTGYVWIKEDLYPDNYHVSYTMKDFPADSLVRIAVHFNGLSPDTANFRGLGEVICVEFARTLNFNPADEVAFDVPLLDESYNTRVFRTNADAGTYATYVDTLFNGNLVFWADASPIAGGTGYHPTNITDCAETVAPVQPDAAGEFIWNIMDSYNIMISKDIDPSTSVISAINGYDGYRTAQVLVEDPTFTPNVYQIIAMDVTMDGQVSAGDLSQISQRAVRIIGEYKQAWNYNDQGISNGEPSYDWLFIEPELTMLDPSFRISTTWPEDDGIGYSKASVPSVDDCKLLDIDENGGCPIIAEATFTGLLLGDISGNWKDLSADGLLKNAQTASVSANFDVVGDKLYVSVSSQVKVTDLSASISLPNGLSLLSYVSNQSNVGIEANITDNQLEIVSWANADKFDTDGILLTLSFDNKISLNDIIVDWAQSADKDIDVTLTENATGVISENNNVIFKYYPNPANSILNVKVSENATVQLIDITGKVVVTKVVKANELMELNVEGYAAGIYTLNVQGNSFVKSQIVFINN